MIEYFDDMSVIATPITIVNDISSGYNVPTPTPGIPVRGVFSETKSSLYLTNLYGVDITGIFVTSDVTQILRPGKLTINGTTYEVENILDPGSMNASGWDNDYVITLKAVL